MLATRVFLLLAPLAILGAMTLSACGGGGPQEHTFDLNIEDRVAVQEPTTLKVRKGDLVTIRVMSGEPGAFHLHGYDLEKPVGPEEVAELTFTAAATGSFPFVFHAVVHVPGPGGEHRHGHDPHEEEELPLGRLEVLP